MNLSILSIRRPVLSIVMSITIVLVGIVGFTFLGVRQFPNVDPPIVNVTTTYAGANAEVMESQITEPLEESINGIAGIRSLTSTSADGRSTIVVEFDLGEDLEAATNDVRDRVARAQRNLPPDCDPPIVAKQDANSNAIIVATVQSDRRKLNELSEIANNVFKERLQTIPGVANIQIWGERKFAMRIIMDADKLAGYGMTAADVRAALARENVELPAGRLEGLSTELSLRTLGRLASVDDFESLILRSTSGDVVRLRDVARVYLGAENERTILKREGRPMVGLAISPQPGANQIEIADEFYRRIDGLRAAAPKDIRLEVAFDNTTFIRSAIQEVEETLLIAFGLVVLIIFVFLRSWRATIIPVIAIPVSLVSSFFFMWVFGFSINVLTLLGIVLATGLVVDDAIVVMENIFKKIEHGMDPRKAGEEGSTEIYFAIISTTITLAVVFIPVIFLSGITGALFREFGLVVATSVLVSAFVSLTLTPMMSTRILRRSLDEGWLVRTTEPFFVWLNNGYRRGLAVVLQRRIIAVMAIVVAIVGSVMLGRTLKNELAPLEDRSAMTMMVTGPEGYSYDRMDAVMDTLATSIMRAVPERKMVLTVTSPFFMSGGSNAGFSRLFLTDAESRTRSQMQIAGSLTRMVRDMTDARVIVIQEQTISTGQRAGLPVQVVVMTAELDDLREKLPELLERASRHPALSGVDVNLKFTKPEVTIAINRDRARELGVSVMDIGDAIQAGFSGQRYGFFIRNGKQYQVIGEFERMERTTPDRLRMLSVRSSSGAMVPLADVITLTEQSTPPQLYRYNRAVAATISAGLAPGATIADGIKAMEGIAGQTLDERFSTELAGASRDFAESSSSLLFAFLLALALVYRILAAQFESFVDPLTIMLTVPLALAGAVVSLWVTNETLNIFSQIGVIVLIGLVTKNGILIVEFANQLREQGRGWAEAVEEAAASRFRPILMTSLATMRGALPIALSLGAASGSRTGLGVVVVGGVLLSTLLTLFIIPAVYVVMSRLKRVHVHPATTATTAAIVAMVAMSLPAAAQTVTLDEAIRLGMEKHYGARMARLDSAIATNTERTGLTGYLPTLNVSGAAINGSNSILQNTSSGFTVDRPDAGFTNVNANAVLAWTLFDGMQMFALDDRASMQAAGQRERSRSRMSMAVADVMSVYGEAVIQRALVARARLSRDLVEARYVVEQRRKDAGTISGVELSQAEVDLAVAKAGVIRAETALANAVTTLNTLIGRTVSDTTQTDTSLRDVVLPPLDELRADLLAQNPDLLASLREAEAASHHVRTVNAAFYPRIAAQAAYQYTNNQNDAGFILSNRTNGWNVGLTLQYNLFNGHTDDLAAQRARLDAERARLTTEELRTQLDERLTMAYRRYQQARLTIDLERTSRAAAERNTRVALEQLRVGTITSVEARSVEQTLIDVTTRAAQVEYEGYLAAVECLRLAGRLVR